MGIKYTIEDIKKQLSKVNPNIEILSTEYISNEKLHCKCKLDNYEWSAVWGSLKRGIGCPSCSKCRHDYDINLIKEKVKIINPNIEILSTEYRNNHSKLKCKCLLDGHIWYVSWDKLRQGQGCPECKKKMSHGDGEYSPKLAERNKEKWLKEEAKVYLIECWNDDERFYKIGITKNTIDKRFYGNVNMPYNYKTLKLIHTNKYDATYIEKGLHEKHEEYSYQPKIKFAGHTECFSYIILDKIEQSKNITK